MNIHRRKWLQLVLCLLMILFLFPGCARNEDAEPTVPRFKFLRKKAEILTVAAVEEDFDLLEECINLQYLDLTGSTCYESILSYIARHPNTWLTTPMWKLSTLPPSAI